MTTNRRKFLKNSAIASALAPLANNNLMGEGKKVLTNFQNQTNPSVFNSKIKDDRQIALDLLKPSKRDLEHGLELHKNSLVFDTYGFMPRAAFDGKAIAKAVEEGASELELKDLKEAHSMTRFVDDDREREEFEQAWKASGVTCVFQNAGEESNTVKVLLKRLARFTYVTDMIPDIVGKAVKPENVEKAKSAGRHCLYFSGNGVPMPLDMVSLEEELRYIRVFYQLGIRMMHLTYNRRNLIGDGCGEETDAGLSDFGRAVVEEMNKHGVLIDIAHSGWKTSLEAVQLSKMPVVASHSTVGAIHKHIRSKPDYVIKAIADKEGYLGICCIPRFLGGTGNIVDMLDHIDYIAQKFGPDYVGIGTDVAYTSSFAGEENKFIPGYRRSRNRWEALWPDDDFVETSGMRRSMEWTNWPLFTVGLVQRGYSDSDIQKIIGGNAMRVLKAIS